MIAAFLFLQFWWPQAQALSYRYMEKRLRQDNIIKKNTESAGGDWVSFKNAHQLLSSHWKAENNLMGQEESPGHLL